MALYSEEQIRSLGLVKEALPKHVAISAFVSISGVFGKANQKGVAVRHLHLEDLRRVPIPLPPLAIQQEIVAEIESHEKRIDELKQEIAENEAKIKTAINRVWGKATKPVVDETAHR